MRHFTTVLVLIIATSVTAFGGETLVKQNAALDAPSGNTSSVGVKTPFSLLDLSRLHMSHSYSMSYMSSGGQGRMIGMYLNEIDYQFAKPLRMTFAVGWLHQPQTLFGARGEQLGNQLLPSVHLFWDPSDKFHLSLGFETLSPYQQYNHSLLGRYGSKYNVR